MTTNLDKSRAWLAKYQSVDKTATNEQLFALLDEGATLSFKLKEYKALKDFCAALKCSIAAQADLKNNSAEAKERAKYEELMSAYPLLKKRLSQQPGTFALEIDMSR